MTKLRLRIGLLLGALTAVAPNPARAYNTFPFFLPGGGTGYLKWGDNHAGTPGGVVTWSLMPTGTTLAANAPEYIHGTSDLTSVFNQIGGQAAAVAIIQSAFDHWSQVANVQFMYVGVDDGTPFNAPHAPGQTLGDIRIGAFLIDGFSAGVGYAAPPNGGTTLEGDLIFNTNPEISFYNASGAEGDLYDIYPPGGGLYRNEFGSLVLHELGHALGLDHSAVPSGCMCGYVSPEFDGSECSYYDPDQDGKVPINRIPDADDVAGAQFLYGPPVSADFNADGTVDGADYLIWQRGLGLTAGATRPDGDANNDHMVDNQDLGVWKTQFPAANAVGSAIAEPSTSVLGLLAALASLSLRRS